MPKAGPNRARAAVRIAAAALADRPEREGCRQGDEKNYLHDAARAKLLRRDLPQPTQEKRSQGTDHGRDQRVCIFRGMERHGAYSPRGRFRVPSVRRHYSKIAAAGKIRGPGPEFTHF